MVRLVMKDSRRDPCAFVKQRSAVSATFDGPADVAAVHDAILDRGFVTMGNVGIAMINHPFLMIYTNYLW